MAGNSFDPTDADSQAPGADKAQEAVARQRELDDLRFLLGHPQGRRVLRRIIEKTGIYRSSFHTNGSVTTFNEGRRDIGLWVLAELSAASPDGFHKILEIKPK